MTNAKLIFFWDYDTQWGADRSRAPGGPKAWGNLEFENTERLLELFERYGLKACFAIVGAAAMSGKRPYHDPAQILRIHTAGHEVASHSLYHDWLPGLTFQEMHDTLRISKDVLEQCIGASVTTFVPPYNEPWLYPQKFAFGFSELRYGLQNHVDLSTMCQALFEIGYKFARVSYDPLPQYLFKRVFKKNARILGPIERIAGLQCVHLNTPVGFESTLAFLDERILKQQGVIVVWAHPHSLHLGGPQDERYLIPFLDRVVDLQTNGRMQVQLPRDFLVES